MRPEFIPPPASSPQPLAPVVPDNRKALADNIYFSILLAPENTMMKHSKEARLKKIYTFLYNSKIKDLYDTDLSSAADVLRQRLRKVIELRS
jgi:hypothetical protein